MNMKRYSVQLIITVLFLLAFPFNGWATSPCIDIEKKVIVPGGLFVDADTCDLAPTTTGNAAYRLIVTNCGTKTLKEVVINDPQLGIVDFPVGTLVAGQSMTFTQNEIPELFVEDVCELGSEFQNTATVEGTYLVWLKKKSISASDSACVKCEESPRCSIGDYVWEDADRDGCQDLDTEDPIEGVEVKLFENCGSPTEIDSTTTNAEGFYEFTGLDCGKGYRVQFGDAGDIYTYTNPESCTDGDPDIPENEQDSDCSQVDGFSGCVTFPDPENNPNNPTIDCGYVCEGKIGDFVWLDANGTPGCQDPDEPGLLDVTVNLFQVDGCQDVQGLTPFMTTTTDNQGQYLFDGLCPGDYRVKFVDPEGRDNTIVDQACENFPPGPPPDTTDSDCGGTGECVTLDSNNVVDLTIDCGKLPPDCVLAVDKKCQVEPPVTGPFECDGKVDALKMIWNGPGTLESVTAYRGDVGPETQTLPADISMEVINGVDRQVVTVAGYQPSTNDVQWAWASDSASGTSEFHLSCSDPEMNGPEDCGSPQGDGKNEALPAASDVWLLDGLITVDKDTGAVTGVLDCTPSPIPSADECTFEATPVPGCKTDPEVNSLTSITFRYSGADCSASSNNQGDIGDKWDCEGVPGADPVSISVTKDAGKTSSDKASVNVGDMFTLSNDFSSESIVEVGGQTLTFHTSCSQPLAVGDVFGSLEVVGINGLSPGAEVTYFYEVTNAGITSVDVTSVFDSELGELLDSPPKTLDPSESFTLNKSTFISETTTNLVTVNGNVSGLPLSECNAEDDVTVNVIPPPPPLTDLCDDVDKLQKLTMKYIGGDANVNSQDSDKVVITGNPGTLSPVYIIAHNKDEPFKSDAKIWFSGVVNLNNIFVIDSMNAGENDLDSNTYVYIFEGADVPQPPETPLQSIKFHTSCSQPLFPNDIFGAIQLLGFTNLMGDFDYDGDVDGIDLYFLELHLTEIDFSVFSYNYGE
jgi:hypothetical protein